MVISGKQGFAHLRLFEYTVLPDGLSNASSSFQNIMTEVLQEFLDSGVVVYLEHKVLESKVPQGLQEE